MGRADRRHRGPEVGEKSQPLASAVEGLCFPGRVHDDSADEGAAVVLEQLPALPQRSLARLHAASPALPQGRSVSENDLDVWNRIWIGVTSCMEIPKGFDHASHKRFRAMRMI
jgi:hypothetical protein